MNYPIWDLPASGLLIAGIAIVHVFISHFAVGGGLFLVLTEGRARRSADAALLGYVRVHSRFFILLTLVLGAVTGVGIWFTIGLVHPAATSSLIQTWVWAWAIEWTFFFAEIAAAMVYYYGWDRLSARAHLAVGWVYFANAWLSLFVINGILTFMLTPGAWVTTRGFLDGFFNPTFWPALAARSFAAVGLAGLYALLTAAWLRDGDLRARVARDAALGWVLPMAVALPASLVWYLSAAAGAGVPVPAILGTASGGAADLLAALTHAPASGHPVVRAAAQTSVVASVLCLAVALAVAALRHRVAPRLLAGAAMIAGLAALGGAEWVREGLRKPYVIGQFMFVNGVRLPPPRGVPAPAGEAPGHADAFTVAALDETGVLRASLWARVDASAPPGDLDATLAHGQEMYRLMCTSCHTIDGHLAVRPLVRGRSVETIEGVLGRLAAPVGPSGAPTTWDDPALRLATWRERRMPPLVGTGGEKHALAMYLAHLGGTSREALSGPASAGDAGQAFFEANCAMCHGPDGAWALSQKPARTADAYYEMLGRLPEVNEMMPPFPGSDVDRRAVATHLASLAGGGSVKEVSR